jgi:hypothetical protein
MRNKFITENRRQRLFLRTKLSRKKFPRNSNDWPEEAMIFKDATLTPYVMRVDILTDV